MRAVVVSGGVLAVVAIFGLGVVVGRFVLTRDVAAVSAPTNAVSGTTGLDNTLGDLGAVVSANGGLNTLPSAPAAPLPPASPPGSVRAPPPSNMAIDTITAGDASAAAMAASSVTAGCNIKISRDAPIRSWTQKDRIAIAAIGETCGASTIAVSLETPAGASLYSLQAPARDFGILPQATAEDVRARLSTVLPTDAIRAAAYPQWPAGSGPPIGSEFSREAYEAVRTNDAPITCVRMPNIAPYCLANDPTDGRIKIYTRR
jgi:hypothetical protein